MQMKPTIVTVLDTRRGKNQPISSETPVTFKKAQKYYPVGFDLSQEEFDKMCSIAI